MGMPGGIGQAATEGAEAAEEAGGDHPVAPPGRCPGRQQTCTCAGKHAFQPAHTLPHFGTPQRSYCDSSVACACARRLCLMLTGLA